MERDTSLIRWHCAADGWRLHWRLGELDLKCAYLTFCARAQNACFCRLMRKRTSNGARSSKTFLGMRQVSVSPNYLQADCLALFVHMTRELAELSEAE